MSAADTLRAARALIDTPEKWCKGAARIGCRRCIVGALLDVAGYPRTEMRIYGPARNVLHDLVRAQGHEVIDWWNDDPATTHADVLALFDRAIARAEATPTEEGR